jgi:hypothetical protein
MGSMSKKMDLCLLEPSNETLKTANINVPISLKKQKSCTSSRGVYVLMIRILTLILTEIMC